MAITLSPKTHLDWSDYSVVSLVLLVSALCGFYFRRQTTNKSKEEEQKLECKDSRTPVLQPKVYYWQRKKSQPDQDGVDVEFYPSSIQSSVTPDVTFRRVEREQSQSEGQPTNHNQETSVRKLLTADQGNDTDDPAAEFYQVNLQEPNGKATGAVERKMSIKDKALEEYSLGSRNLSTFPLAMSIMATSLSSFSLTGITGELYLYGASFFFDFVGLALGSIFSAYFIVPVYRQQKYISVFEIMEQRFDGHVRRIFSFAYIFQKLLYLSLVLYLPALSLTMVTQFDYRLTAVVIGSVCTLYSALGGLRAVIWTDVIQAALMFFSLVIVMFQAITAHEEPFLWSLWESGYLSSFRYTEDPKYRYSIWAILAFGFMWTLDLFLVNQAVAQRVLGAKSTEAAKKSAVFGGIICLLFGILLTAMGGALYIYYRNCDPVTLKSHTRIQRIDQFFVYAIGDLFVGVPFIKGVAISGIISASLSTFSSFVNSFACLTLEDFLRPAFPQFTSSKARCLFVVTVLNFVYGGVAILGSFLIPLMGNAVKAFGVMNGILGGPIIGAAFLTFIYAKTTKAGCLFGVLIGIAFNTWIVIGGYVHAGTTHIETLPVSTNDCLWDDALLNLTSFSNYTVSGRNPQNLTNQSVFMPLYQVSFLWYPAIGFLAANLSGFLVCLVTGGIKSTTEQ